jgi:hypothetical protein
MFAEAILSDVPESDFDDVLTTSQARLHYQLQLAGVYNMEQIIR